MNRARRRLWSAFVDAGGETTDRRAIERFQQLIDDQVSVMPPSLSSAMRQVLGSDGEVDYRRLATDLAAAEGVPVRPAAARQRMSRALRRLERVIRATSWIKTPRPDRSAIVFKPAARSRTSRVPIPRRPTTRATSEPQ